MIKKEDILNMNFYKKTCFTGSYLGMHYRLEQDKSQEPALFLATIWPGPYNSANTADELKKSTHFPFTEEGQQQMVDWLNAQWLEGEGSWPAH